MVTKMGSAGPLDELDFNPFTTENLVYPQDLEKLSHAMVFSINIPTLSQDAKSEPAAISPNSRSQTLRNDQGVLNFTSGTSSGIVGKAVGTGTQVGTQRKTTRIAKTISLYVPEVMIFDDRQEYFQQSFNQQLSAMRKPIGNATKAAGYVGALAALLKGHPFVALGAASAGIVAEKLLNSAADVTGLATGGDTANLFTEFLGYAINPRLEVIYGSPDLRQFQFEFNLVPRNAQEANNIGNIIQTFREFSRPELSTGENSGAFGTAFSKLAITGAFFIPPAEFDITFFMQDRNGNFVQNPNIPTIATCWLEEINVNFAPEGQWITHKDGFPVHTQMRLMFTENTIITRKDVKRGF